MNKTEYINASDIEITGNLKERISLKPVIRIILRGVIGAVLCFLRTKLTIIAGIFFLVIAVAGYFMIKDKPVMDIYNDAVVVYDEMDPSKACKIMYEDLKMWSVDSTNNRVYFTLQDDSIVSVNNSRYLKVYDTLTKLIPDKCEPSLMEKLRTKLKKGDK
ncbi:MAG: hypothetical protein IJG59_01105 [Erysipelotrichaceae bacterium]|nr:hypothetical protein [Erysipelotrichaceae bacterium]